jgi:hypothetical protein
MDRPTPDVVLILTRDASGHAILIREEAGAGPVLVACWPWRTNRPVPLRRRWLREMNAAAAAGLNVRAVEMD